jgi:hypothetical protein
MKAPGKTATGAVVVVVVLFAACAVLAVVAWRAIGGDSGAVSAGPVPGLPEGNGQSSASSGDDRGAVNLPPAGASPSTPEEGELLAILDARPGTGFPARFVPVHQVWVYSDGRVVWRREGGPNGETGFNEQRLTREGVELLRSELLSTGLFARDGYYVSEQGLSWGEIKVRNGDRLVSVVWCCPASLPSSSLTRQPDLDPTPRQARALIRLSEGLAELTSWLPQSAWDEQEATAHVASRYAICYRQQGFEPGETVGLLGTDLSLEPSRILGALPAEAQELLRVKDETYVVASSPLRAKDSAEHAACTEVTIEDARVLEAILNGAGLERAPYPALAATYSGRASSPIGRFFISFEPILPHGQWERMGG